MKAYLPLVVVPLFLVACNSEALEEFLGPERNCEVRQAFYPDADGDGVSEPGAIFIGCSAPEGYISTPPGEQPEPTEDSADTATETGG